MGVGPGGGCQGLVMEVGGGGRVQSRESRRRPFFLREAFVCVGQGRVEMG